MPHLDVKVSCSNCGATSTMRLDETTPFYGNDGTWHKEDFPCPVCQSATVIKYRPQRDWIELPEATPTPEEVTHDGN